MEDLYYCLKYVKTPEGNFTIFISHPNGTPNSRWYSKEKERVVANRAKTTKFAKWLRKTYPHIITEFRGLHSHWYDTKRHFVAYDLSPKEFVYLKLAMDCESIREIGVGYNSEEGRTNLGYNYVYEHNLKPSDEYLERQEKAKERAELKAYNEEIRANREAKNLSTDV